MTGPVTVYRSVPQTVPVTVDVDTTLSVLHRCQGTDRRQTIWVLPYIGLWLSGQDVDRNEFYAVSRSTSMHRSLPGDDTGHILTGPFIGYLVTDQLTGPVTSPVTGQH